MTDRYALFGNPIAHSKSPLIHGTFARETRQDIGYELVEAPRDGFATAVKDFRAQGGRGMNVTMPFKLEAFGLATDLSERARRAGAVNAMKVDGDRLLGENFDGAGLVNDIQRNLGHPISGKRVLLLGAGGAARGAMLPILEQQPVSLTVVNRTIARALSLRQQFDSFGSMDAGGYECVNGRLYDIVINATSASMRAELPPVPASAFAEECLAYDVVYGRGLTPFLRLARDQGVTKLADGVGMLVEQAAEAFQWWRGARPTTAPVIEALRVPLVPAS
jgi:shikimate dehydrogenase